MSMTRREFIQTTSAAAAAASMPRGWYDGYEPTYQSTLTFRPKSLMIGTGTPADWIHASRLR